MIEGRHDLHRPPLNPREKLLITFASFTLLWTVWTPGNARPWAMTGSAILSGVTFLLLFAPLGRAAEGTARANLRHLLRSPIFWLGFGLVAYVGIQALNKSYSVVDTAGGSVRILSHKPIPWLPSGMLAPLRMEGTGQMLLVFLGIWPAASAVAAGLRRRSAQQALLWVISVSSSLWALLGMAQRITDTSKMLWLTDSGAVNKGFFATLTNPNHAAALLNLGLIATLTLFLRGFSDGRYSLMRGGPHLLCIPLTLACLAGLLLAASRAGLVVAAAILVAFLAVGLVRLFAALRNDKRSLVVLAVVCAMVGIGVAGVAASVDWRMIEREWRSAWAVAEDPASDLRYDFNRATVDLIAMRPAYGWGMGTYRYYIQQTQYKYESLKQLSLNKNRKLRRQIMFAHNDYLQYLAELGWTGYSFILGFFAYAGWKILTRLHRAGAGLVFATLGMLAFLPHAALEFFFYRPAVLMQFCLLSVVLLKLIDLEGSRQTRSAERDAQGL